MLHPLITLRHDQDWIGAAQVLTLFVFFLVVAGLDRWINGGADLQRDYDDRIHQPYPPKPAGGDR